MAPRPVDQKRAELARASASVAQPSRTAPATTIAARCSAAAARRSVAAGHTGHVETGEASYYGAKFDGRRTASGERYDPRKFTAAHKSLPLGTIIRVTRTSGGADGPSVEVRVNDRCGCTHGRIVDLSRAAAQRLHMLNDGVASVRVEVVRR